MDLTAWVTLTASLTAFATAVLLPIVLELLKSSGAAKQKLIDARLAADAKRYEDDRADRIRREDIERQDTVAAKAAEVARRLLVSSEAVAKTAQVTIEKLDVIHQQGASIHTLVNSKLSAALRTAYDALVGQLAALRELVALRLKDDKPPGAEALAAIQSLEARIAELHNVLTERGEDTGKEIP